MTETVAISASLTTSVQLVFGGGELYAFRELGYGMDDKEFHLADLTAELVGAYVSNNSLPVGDLPKLIADVYAALKNLGAPSTAASPEPTAKRRKSVFPDYLISLEDGKQYKTLKRHLAGLGLSPDEYRAKWGLARDYPMVAASYSEKRSALAKSTGLGRKKVQSTPPEPAKPKRRRAAKAQV